MGTFIVLAFLFAMGSFIGWCLELVFRKFFSGANPEHKWINPGFCVGPYVPLYGFGLCILFTMAAAGQYFGFDATVAGRIILFALMAVFMTVIEYIAGLLLLKVAKVRLWDYSRRPGNVNGLICPLFSLFWALLSAAYYFLIHPRVLHSLYWLSQNLTFCFFIGLFFGVFIIDVCYSFKVVTKFKNFAEENGVIVRYENLKAYMHGIRERSQMRRYFFFQFSTKKKTLNEYLADFFKEDEGGHYKDLGTGL